MRASDIPYKFLTPWAADAVTANVTNPVPATATGGAASQQQGFPLLTATPIAAGGIPPSFADFNGLEYYNTSWLQWLQAGGPVSYDSALSTAIGGYPSGALVGSATTLGKIWRSTADNNTTNPDTGGSGWVAQHGMQIFTSSGTLTIPASDLWFDLVGGGGGSGGCEGLTNTCGSPGGGAARVSQFLTGQTIGGTLAITVGAGGTAGTVSPFVNGGNGVASTVASLCSAGGGGGGQTTNGGLPINNGSAGTGTGNSTGGNAYQAISGGLGGLYWVQSGGLITVASSGAAPGNPATQPGSGEGAGSAGQNPGDGASGSVTASGASYNGAAGANGIVVVRW